MARPARQSRESRQGSLSAEAFLKQVDEGSVRGVYLLQGTDARKQQQAVRALREKLLPPGLEQLNENILNAPSADEIISACETLPVMAARRLVIVRDQGGLRKNPRLAEDEADKLTDYLPRMNPDCVLVFRLEGASDGTLRLPKAIRSAGAIVSFDPDARDAGLPGWVAERFREEGVLCTERTAQRLIYRSGADSTMLDGEICKLAALAGQGGTVTDALVDAAATPTVESNVFQMMDHVIGQRQAQAFAMMQALLRDGEERLGLLAMLQREYRVIQRYKVLQLEKLPPEEINRQMKLTNAYRAQRVADNARRLSGAEVRWTVNMLLDTEFRVKTGRLSENACLESALLKIFAYQRLHRGGR